MTKQERDALRTAVADYMRSEGCSCCQDRDAHRAHTHRLGQLLSLPIFKDFHGQGEDGYDFSKYQSPDAARR